MNKSQTNRRIILEGYCGVLSDLRRSCIQTLNFFHNQPFTDNTLLLSLIILEKTQFAVASLRELIPLYLQNTEHEYSIGLLLRTAMNDTLVAAYMDQTEQYLGREEVNKLSFNFLADGFPQLVKLVKNDPRIDTEAGYNQLYQNYPFFFKKHSDPTCDSWDIERKNDNFKTSTAEIRSELRGESNEQTFYDMIYFNFLYYSKYAHIQLMYLPLSRAHTSEKDIKIKDCINAISFQVGSLIGLLYRLTDHNRFLSQVLDNHRNYEAKLWN